MLAEDAIKTVRAVNNREVVIFEEASHILKPPFERRMAVAEGRLRALGQELLKIVRRPHVERELPLHTYMHT